MGKISDPRHVVSSQQLGPFQNARCTLEKMCLGVKFEGEESHAVLQFQAKGPDKAAAAAGQKNRRPLNGRD